MRGLIFIIPKGDFSQLFCNRKSPMMITSTTPSTKEIPFLTDCITIQRKSKNKSIANRAEIQVYLNYSEVQPPKSLHNKIFSVGKCLLADKLFRNFASNKPIVCRSAYAHSPRCIHAYTALHTRVCCPADNKKNKF